ncbi:hypothetical protein [Leptolyngbya sp. PCC 6406]|uniref:hypothetical protein n=1 Tax=Leptolyngbya sp. PCC 6406 TaxID=1173264 RepID=UPI0012DCDE8E|nr:hypothetical protein [Leptolyngbya sp. PCC 6406]
MGHGVGHQSIRDLSSLADLRQFQSLCVFGNGIIKVALLQNFTRAAIALVGP